MLSLGCSKEDIEGLGDTLKEQTDKIVQQGKDAAGKIAQEGEALLPESGKISLQSAPPVETSKAIAEMHVVGDGRKNSIQICSYEPGAQTTGSPSVFIHATTSIQSVALLAGQTVPCNVYVEMSPNSPIARNQIGSPVPIVFGSMNMSEKTITATIGQCTLVDTDGKPFSVGGGEILAVVRGN